MKSIFLLFLLFILSSCGAKKAFTSIDPAFVKYVQNFQKISNDPNVAVPKKVINIEMSLRSDLGQDIAGLCYKDEYESSFWNQVSFTFNGKPEEQRHVEINKGFWDKSTDAEREAVIFHELGHCILNRDHVNGYDNSNLRYYSVMNSDVFADSIYKGNYQYYMRELFKSKFFNVNENNTNQLITFNATYYNPNALTSLDSEYLVNIPESEHVDSYEEALNHTDKHPCQVKTLEEYKQKMEERKQLENLENKDSYENII